MSRRSFKTSLIFLCFPCWLWCAAQTQSFELSNINEKLSQLKEELHRNQMHEMKDEVDGQGLMIADWNKYAQEIEKVKELEEHNRDLIQQINQLEVRKAQLLRQGDAG